MFFKRKRKKNKLKKPQPAPRNFARPAAWIGGIVLLMAAGAGVWHGIRSAGLEEFRALQITGEMENVQANDVREVLAPFIKAGFVDLDIAAAREAVESLPWVEEAAVRRQWPGILAVEIFEQQPVATWYGTALMNRKGEVFIDGAAGYSGVLPDISGPSGTQREMLGELAGVMQQLVGQDELVVRRLLRSERRAERIWLQNGLEIRLGRHDTDERLQRFMNIAWPVVRPRLQQVAYVDMRYDNGFSVGWKDPADHSATSGETTDVQENG